MADVLGELKALIDQMSDEEKAELDAILEDELAEPWLPTPGPQSDAFFSDADLLLYGGAAGGGKLLDVETPIPTPHGFTKMGALRKGDTIFDEMGRQCRVTVISPIRTDAKAYVLIFDDGSEITACADHLWLTFDTKELGALTRLDPEWRARRRAKRPSRAKGNKSPAFVAAISAGNATRIEPQDAPSGTVRTTQQIVDTLLTPSGRRNHAIPVCGAVETEPKNLLVEPYVLGAWLGDGTAMSGGFTGIDPFIWEQIALAGYTVTHSPVEAKRHYIRNIVGKFRAIGVLGNKHIPDIYLRGSKGQRWALLQGLMDTDGHAALDGACEFDNTNRRLIDGVYELVVSLGMKASITEGRAKLNGQDMGPKWRVKFMANGPAFLLPRKAARLRQELRRTNRFRYIVDAIEVDPVPMRCIAVDSPSRLYLAGRSFIPTHNTDLILGLALTRHRRSVVFRRAYTDLKGITERLAEIMGSEGLKQQPPRYRRNGRLIEFGALAAPGSEESWQGIAHDLVCFDEGAQLSVAKVVFVMGWIRSADANQRCRAVIASNPPTGGEGGWLLSWFAPWLDPLFANPAKPGELRWAITVGIETQWVDGPGKTLLDGEEYTHESRTFIPAMLEDNPYLRDTNYRARIQNMPEPLRSILLKGDFLAGRVDHEWQVIPTDWVRSAQDRWNRAEVKRRTMIALAADIALGGQDNTVLAPLYEDAWFGPLVRKKGVECRDPADVALMMLQAQRNGADLSVDGTGGWGSGVRSHLKNAHGLECASVVFSTRNPNAKTKDGKLGYANLRAQMYWQFREALDPEDGEEVMLPPDPHLTAELTAARYEVKGTLILIEDKDEIKKRVGSSPDDADAVVMAWHRRRAAAKKAIKTTDPKPIASPIAGSGGWMAKI